MLRCPMCEKIIREVRATGPILVAVGVLEISNDGGEVTAVSPMSAIQTVKIGEEIIAPGFTFTCLACNGTAPREEFGVVCTCVFCGEPTELFVLTPFGPIYVKEEYAADAERVFTLENATDESALSAEELV